VEDISKMIQELELDVICLQECDGMHLKKLLKMLEQGPKAFNMVKWGGCAIISSLPMQEVEIEQRKSRTSQGRAEGGLLGRTTYHPRFVTARIQCGEGKMLVVTCLHLDHKLEPRRMKEVATIQENLASLFKRGEAQVWTGDFNALTREDYTEVGWATVAEVRARGGWEKPQRLQAVCAQWVSTIVGPLWEGLAPYQLAGSTPTLTMSTSAPQLRRLGNVTRWSTTPPRPRTTSRSS